MQFVKSGELGESGPVSNSVSAQQVVNAAHDELLQLMRQRAEVMKRIGTVKQTIAGLANLFGEQLLDDDLLELIDRKPNGRQPGFTKPQGADGSEASAGSAGGLRGVGAKCSGNSGET